MMRASVAPIVRAASTYWLFDVAIAALRTTRIAAAEITNPTIKMIQNMRPYGPDRPAKTLIAKTSSTTAGIDRMISTTRWTIVSIQPPKKPEMVPTVSEISTTIATEA